MIIAFTYMFVILIFFHSMPELLLKLFSAGDDANRLAIGSEALRICSICFIPASFSVIMIAMFNSVGHGVKAMLISLLRQICILLPLGYVLSTFTSLGFKGFWASFPIAEAVSVLIFTPVAINTINKIFKYKAEELQANVDLECSDINNPDTDDLVFDGNSEQIAIADSNIN